MSQFWNLAATLTGDWHCVIPLQKSHPDHSESMQAKYGADLQTTTDDRAPKGRTYTQICCLTYKMCRLPLHVGDDVFACEVLQSAGEERLREEEP